MGADPISWALIASAVAATAGTAHSIESSNEQRRRQDRAIKNNNEDMAKLQAQRNEQDINAKTEDEMARQRQRQKAMAQQYQGRNSTVLTSPLGEVGTAASQPTKTLLGQ